VIDLVVDLVVDLIANEFRRSNSLNAGGQSGTFERLSQNAVFVSSADRNPTLFHGGSGDKEDSIAGSILNKSFRF